jgi:hypothetical protein
MTFFLNRDINRLSAHASLHALAWCFCGLFSAVFLLRAGLTEAQTFLVFAAILTLRFALRPLVLALAPAIGLRRTMILGTLVFACQFPLLALVQGLGPALALYCLVSALGDVLYWPCSHAFFAAVGESELRGSQVAERQVLGALAGVVGPVAGGLMLTAFGPWPAFLAAFVTEIAAIAPLLYVTEPPVARKAAGGAFASAKAGIGLFFADGWVSMGAGLAWAIMMFRGLGARYDAFGGALAAAALAGALGGMLLGRFIDRGHALQSTLLNTAILAGSFIVKSLCKEVPIAIIAVAIGTTLFGGLYLPTLLTALYNEAKASPCPLRFHFAAEGGWDAGGTAACLVAAAICIAEGPLKLVVLLGLPMTGVQAWLLLAHYSRRELPQGAAAPAIAGDA